jgi:hypothetical protein
MGRFTNDFNIFLFSLKILTITGLEDGEIGCDVGVGPAAADICPAR